MPSVSLPILAALLLFAQPAAALTFTPVLRAVDAIAAYDPVDGPLVSDQSQISSAGAEPIVVDLEVTAQAASGGPGVVSRATQTSSFGGGRVDVAGIVSMGSILGANPASPSRGQSIFQLEFVAEPGEVEARVFGHLTPTAQPTQLAVARIVGGLLVDVRDFAATPGAFDESYALLPGETYAVFAFLEVRDDGPLPDAGSFALTLQVPEPAAGALLGSAGLALAGAARRRGVA